MESIITPIERLTPISRISGTSGADSTAAADKADAFKDLYTSAINNVIDTDYLSVTDTENLATGDVDDLHTLSIDNMKSYLAVDMLVQLRNKALDSYNQIMQINV
jgi:flagellar hook-basal body complex protein FliE